MAKLQNGRRGGRLGEFVAAGVHIYAAGVLMWAVLCALFGDRWAWLFVLNSFAAWLFLPLPLVLGAAVWVRRRSVWVGAGAVLALWVALYGRLFVPNAGWKGIPAGWAQERETQAFLRPSHNPADDPTLMVMNYNVLGAYTPPEAVAATIRATDADVVALQELTPPVVAHLDVALAEAYPYRVLDPQDGVSGMGVYSRWPLQALPAGTLAQGVWVGAPQVLRLEWEGTPVLLLNVHPNPTHLGPPDLMRASIRRRAARLEAVAAFAAAHPGPLVVAGDLNTTPCNADYRVLRRAGLGDAWVAAGWGLGHTFPRATSAWGRALLPWLVRIDYVLYSQEWDVVRARVGPWDGYSDHRPVVAELVEVR